MTRSSAGGQRSSERRTRKQLGPGDRLAHPPPPAGSSQTSLTGRGHTDPISWSKNSLFWHTGRAKDSKDGSGAEARVKRRGMKQAKRRKGTQKKSARAKTSKKKAAKKPGSRKKRGRKKATKVAAAKKRASAAKTVSKQKGIDSGLRHTAVGWALRRLRS